MKVRFGKVEGSIKTNINLNALSGKKTEVSVKSMKTASSTVLESRDNFEVYKNYSEHFELNYSYEIGSYQQSGNLQMITKNRTYNASTLRSKLLKSSKTATKSVKQSFSQEKVDSSLKKIRDALKEDVFDWDVTRSDLDSIKETLASLPPAEFNQVIKKLKPAELSKLFDELNGTIGGYSEKELDSFMKMMIQKSDTRNLIKMALIPANKEVKDAYIKALPKYLGNSEKVDFIKQASEFSGTPEVASATVKVIGSLRNNPELLEKAVSGLSRKQVKNLIKGALDNEVVEQGDKSLIRDIKVLNDTYSAISKIHNAKVKANFVAEGIESTDRMKNMNLSNFNDLELEMTENISKVVKSDPAGVMEELHKIDNDNKVMKSYINKLVRYNQTETIVHIYEGLRPKAPAPKTHITYTYHYTYSYKVKYSGAPKLTPQRKAQHCGRFTGLLIKVMRELLQQDLKNVKNIRQLFTKFVETFKKAYMITYSIFMINKLVESLKSGNSEGLQNVINFFKDLTFPDSEKENKNPEAEEIKKNYQVVLTRTIQVEVNIQQ